MNQLKAKMQAELNNLQFIYSDFDLKAINGGAINKSYRLDTSNKSYFVKTFESNQMAALNRERLFDTQMELVSKGLAVTPVYLSRDHDFQIDQWLNLPTLAHNAETDLTNIKCLASALSTIHNTQVSAERLDLPKQWHHYIRVIGQPVSASLQQTIERYSAIWRQACKAKVVFCHNDLALSHVTKSQSNIIFDWEYCAISCPYFDLASCVIINDLSSTDEASLCAFYAQYSEQRLSDVTAKVTKMKPLVTFTNKLWYQAARTSI